VHRSPLPDPPPQAGEEKKNPLPDPPPQAGEGKEDPLPDPPPQAGEGKKELLPGPLHKGEGEIEPQGGRESSPRCPFCQATDTEVISLFGSQVMTMQCKCRACGSFYEASKY